MITGGKTSVSRSLYMGDPVRIIYFYKYAKDKWLAGVVTDKHGPLILPDYSGRRMYIQKTS